LAASDGRASAASDGQVAALPSASVASAAEISGAHASSNAAPPWELLHPLSKGSVVTPGWQLVELSEVADGACVLTVRNSRGRAYRVHLCRNDGRPHGLVHTDRFDLLVMNGGQGDQPTDEGLAQTLAAIGHVLAANEHERRHAAVLAALLPHAERVQLLASAAQLR